jgi:hypothetical protein
MCGRVLSTLNVCSVAKCKYPLRIVNYDRKSFTAFAPDQSDEGRLQFRQWGDLW